MSEHQKAKAWRLARGLSVAELAEQTGYSAETIYWMERGLTPSRPGRKSQPIDQFVWQRYKNCCAGVDARLRSAREFAWKAG